MRSHGPKGAAKQRKVVALYGGRPTSADAAVDNQMVSAHEPRSIADQKQRRIGDVVDSRHVGQGLPPWQYGGNRRFRIFNALVRFVMLDAGALGENSRGYRSWRQAVDANSLFSQFHRGAARQVYQRRLCRRVGNTAQSGPRPVDARDIDDAAGPLRGHHRHGILHGGKRAPDVDAELDGEALPSDLAASPTLLPTPA